jgi:hypothetical protein
MNDLPPSDDPPQIPEPPTRPGFPVTHEPPELPPAYAAPLPPAFPAAPVVPLNPWLAIWTQPRATMRQILGTDPRRLVHVLAILGALSRMLSSNVPPIGPLARLSLSAIVAYKVCASVVGGLIGLYLGSAILTMTGRWLGGRGSFVAVRAAAAWSNVPLIWGSLLWLPMLGYLGVEALNFDPKVVFEDPGSFMMMIPIGVLAGVVGIWTLVIALKCLGEAHGFSAWQAVGAVLIGIAIVAIPFAILAGIVIGMLGASGALHL